MSSNYAKGTQTSNAQNENNLEKHLETDKSICHSQMIIFMKDIDSQLRELHIFSSFLSRVTNVTHRRRTLTVPQTVCMASLYFATGTFMQCHGDMLFLFTGVSPLNPCCYPWLALTHFLIISISEIWVSFNQNISNQKEQCVCYSLHKLHKVSFHYFH